MRRRWKAVGLVGLTALVCVVLPACGGGATAGTSGNGSGPATTSIGPAGGTLTSADGVVTLTIPKGALATTETFGIAPAASAPSGAILAYELTPSGTTFAVPATLAVDTSALTLPAGSTAADVRIETASGGAWQGLFTSLDSSAHTATASLAHLSTYGVLALGLSSTLVMGWTAADPLASVYADDANSGVHRQATVAQPVAGEAPPASAAVPAAPSCLMWSWLHQLAYYDVSGVHQWMASASYPSSSVVSTATDALGIAGSGTDFTVTSTAQGSAGPGNALAGTYNFDATSIDPDIIATIHNPSETARTLTLRFTSHAVYNGISNSEYAGGAAIEIDDVAADGSCLGGTVKYVTAALPNSSKDETLSYAVPAGTATIWVDVEKRATVDLHLDIYRTTPLVAKLDEELHVQVE